MKFLTRSALVALIAGAAVGLAALPAVADGGSIFNQRTNDETRTIRFYFDASNPELTVNPESVQVAIDDRRSPRKVTSGDDTPPQTKTAVLTIDTSGSMKGDRIEGAKRAARAFLTAVPADVRVGLVTFADDVNVAVPPTTNRLNVRRAVDGLVAEGDTALYDAVQRSVQVVGSEGLRSIVLLSDGADDGSDAKLAQATRAVSQAAGVRLYAIALELESKSAGAALRQLTRAGQGEVIPSGNANDLADTFETVARTDLDQVEVTLQVPPELADGQVRVSVEATAGGQRITASQLFSIGRPPAAATPTQQVETGPRAVAIDPGPWGRSVVPYAAMGLVFVGVSVLFGFAFNAFQPVGQRGRISRRLAIYTLGGRPTPVAKEVTGFGQGPVMQGAVDLASRFVAQRRMEVGLRRRLDAAGLPFKPPEWVLIQVGSALGVPIVLGVLSGSPVLALLGLFIGAAGPIAFLMIAESRRQQRFVEQLPDTLQLISGSLSTGYSLPQALDSVVQEGTEPVAGEFNRALVDHRLGRPIDDALRAIAVRMRSDEWHWVVMAIRIQREVGGNLAELLTTVADTLRDRARLNRQVKALSAEGRLSSYILIGLPIVFAIYLLVTQPRYIGALLTDPVGLLGLGLSVVLLIIGALWLRRIIKVEI
jgi:tight adherence protein B